MSFVLMGGPWQAASMTSISLRLAGPADRDALDRLAALDSAAVLPGQVLLAESGGALQAALSLDDDRAVADPFAPTAELVALLRTRAALLRAAPPERSRAPGGLQRLRQAFAAHR
jgi:hypothetical protein